MAKQTLQLNEVESELVRLASQTRQLSERAALLEFEARVAIVKKKLGIAADTKVTLKDGPLVSFEIEVPDEGATPAAEAEPTK